jgi:hypothetical protein
VNILTECIKRSWLGELSQEARIIHNIAGEGGYEKYQNSLSKRGAPYV